MLDIEKTMVQFVENILKKGIEISERIKEGWAVIAKRWVVMRTFAWLNYFRNLSKDCEIAVTSAENIIMIVHP